MLRSGEEGSCFFIRCFSALHIDHEKLDCSISQGCVGSE
jgi:hypothetical protein